MESAWKKTAQKPQFDAFGGNKKADVLIIGGGIAGILCVYKLKKCGRGLYAGGGRRNLWRYYQEYHSEDHSWSRIDLR